MFETLSPPRPDSLMEIGRLFREDGRGDKIDLGVGTYRNAQGQIEVMASIKEAERRHAAAQTGKGYLGPGGDRRFCELLLNQHFPGLAAMAERRMALVQAPGGTGAYRLGLELVAHHAPETTLVVGLPTWPNHIPVAEKVGLKTRVYRYFDQTTGAVQFDAMIDAIARSRPGDLFLLHGCCHNPTGAALTPEQWAVAADAIARARLIPVIDLAYAGMAKGLKEDVAATRVLLEMLPEAIVAISCSKSFGLYSERTGMLAVLAPNAKAAGAARLTAESLARSLWSNPPEHGAALVRIILDDQTLCAEWLVELESMRLRLGDVRAQLAASALAGSAMLAEQEGLFAMLALAPEQIAALRSQHGVYMDATGRINIAGLNQGNIARFLNACNEVTHNRVFA